MVLKEIIIVENNRENTAPVGVFDSGVGGLTVAREIMRQLPMENVVYLEIRQEFPMEASPEIILSGSPGRLFAFWRRRM
jgi:hypothetical protein